MPTATHNLTFSGRRDLAVFREMSDGDLQRRLMECGQLELELRTQSVTTSIEDTSVYRKLRSSKARIRTILNERKLEIVRRPEKSKSQILEVISSPQPLDNSAGKPQAVAYSDTLQPLGQGKPAFFRDERRSMPKYLVSFPSPFSQFSPLASEMSIVSGVPARGLQSVNSIAIMSLTDSQRHQLEQKEGARVFEDVKFEPFPNYGYRPGDVTGSGDGSDDPRTLDDVMRHIHVDRVRSVSTGKGVFLAVVDTGIPESFADISSARRLSIPTPGALYDGKHWDADLKDPIGGHGAMCAGVAAAGKGNFAGGVAPETTVISLRTSFEASDLAILFDALVEAMKNRTIDGRLVVSNSYGLRGCKANIQITEDYPLHVVVASLVNAGIVFTYAAGNSHTSKYCSCGKCVFSPTAESPNTIWGMNSLDAVITAGNVDGQEQNTNVLTPHHDSSRGPGEHVKFGKKPDLVAPTYGRVYWGNSIQFRASWGTSGACPQVAGLAALLLQLNPSLKPSDVAAIIKNSCSHPNDVSGQPASALCVGHGVIDCEAALRALGGPS